RGEAVGKPGLKPVPRKHTNADQYAQQDGRRQASRFPAATIAKTETRVIALHTHGFLPVVFGEGATSTRQLLHTRRQNHMNRPRIFLTSFRLPPAFAV